VSAGSGAQGTRPPPAKRPKSEEKSTSAWEKSERQLREVTLTATWCVRLQAFLGDAFQVHHQRGVYAGAMDGLVVLRGADHRAVPVFGFEFKTAVRKRGAGLAQVMAYHNNLSYSDLARRGVLPDEAKESLCLPWALVHLDDKRVTVTLVVVGAFGGRQRQFCCELWQRKSNRQAGSRPGSRPTDVLADLMCMVGGWAKAVKEEGQSTQADPSRAMLRGGDSGASALLREDTGPPAEDEPPGDPRRRQLEAGGELAGQGRGSQALPDAAISARPRPGWRRRRRRRRQQQQQQQ